MALPAAKDSNLLFLDFETGGFSPATADIIEAACILTDPSGKTILGEYVAKVTPLRPVDPGAAAVNGYTTEKWAGVSIPLEQALIKILGFAKDAMLCAHNTPFDKAFLDDGMAKHKMRWPGRYYTMDTYALAMPLLRAGVVENMKLATLTAFFGIDHNDAHTAMSDVRACREVYLRLMALYEPSVTKLATARS